jgi:hypothetical protein
MPSGKRRIKMLREIDPNGKSYPVTSLPAKYLDEFNYHWNRLSESQQMDIEDEINRRLDELVHSPNPNWGSITNTSIEGGKVSPETGIRGDWTGTPFAPLWDLFGDDELAGKFFGNVWKKVIIARPNEEWFGIRASLDRPTFPNRGILLDGKTYFLQDAQAA